MQCAVNGRILAEKLIVADTFLSRFKGLLGQREMPAGTALMIKPCRQVHMWFMRFAIGAIFLDNQGLILNKQLLKPWQRPAPEINYIDWVCKTVLAKPELWIIL